MEQDTKCEHIRFRGNFYFFLHHPQNGFRRIVGSISHQFFRIRLFFFQEAGIKVNDFHCKKAIYGRLQNQVVGFDIGMYHTMLQRVVPYTIRGFFYYQGENDEIRPDTYGTLLTMLIARWRQDFEDARLPFILVQLPMHTYADTPENGAWSRLREAQMQVYQTVKHTGIAVILDCGEYCNIHPVDKHPVGHRLALQARQLVYGERELEAFGPIFRSFVVEGSTLTVFFSHAAQGMEWHGEPCGFQIAGADGVYHDARAVLDGDTVRLTAAEVPAPAAARYNWVNYGAVTLFGKNGIPAAPFRTEASPLPLTAVCE